MNIINFVVSSIIFGLFCIIPCAYSVMEGPVDQEFTVRMNNSVDVYKLKSVVPGGSTVSFGVENYSINATFFVIQVHSYNANVSVSIGSDSIVGTNIGFVVSAKDLPVRCSVVNDENIPVHLLFVVVTYGIGVPIPGGCNMEKSMYLSSYLNLDLEPNLVTMSAAPGKLGTKSECGPEMSKLSYHLYLMYTPERDFSAATYLDAMSRMVSPEDIMMNGQEVPLNDGMGIKRIMAAYPGTGLVFALLVGDPSGKFAAYVPAHTFACVFSESANQCQLIVSTYAKVGIVFLSVVGLLLCFFGRKWEIFELMSMSLLVGGLAAYFGFYSQEDPHSSKYIFISAGSGLAVGVVAVVIKLLLRFHVIKHVMSLGAFSFFFPCVIFFCGAGNLSSLADDVYFWSFMVGISLCTLMILCWKVRIGHILSTVYLGSYLIILPLDLSGTSFKYIVFDVVRRANVPMFNQALLYPPLQTPDVILLFVWISLAILGKLYHVVSSMRPSGGTTIRRAARPVESATEKTPLLTSASQSLEP